MEKNVTSTLADLKGCKVGSLLRSYLGLPLCPGRVTKTLWIPVVERVEHKLASWKAKYLSLGGRITLIQLSLSNLLIYYMSFSKCRTSIVNRIERLERDFLSQGRDSKNKFYLVE